MTDNQISVSIIVPIYNAAKYLDKCLSSVTGQSFTDIEIVLIDDGSTDSSLQICKKYAENDKRICILSWENHGLAEARKKGISLSHGRYFLFVDADDYIDADTVSLLLREVEDESDIAAFGLIEEYKDREVVKKNKFVPGTYDRAEIETQIFPQMISYGPFFDFGLLPNLVCKLIRRDFYNSSVLHVSGNVSVGEDADLCYQLMMQASSVRIIDLSLYHYCKHDDSMMWSGIGADAIQSLETDLRLTASELKLSDVFGIQLDDYISFIRLLKNPASDLRISQLFSNGERIALYGAGGFGQALYAVYGDRIVLWSDKDYEKYRSKGLPVVSPEELFSRAEEYDSVFVSILNGSVCEKVKKSLTENLHEKKIAGYDRN